MWWGFTSRSSSWPQSLLCSNPALRCSGGLDRPAESLTSLSNSPTATQALERFSLAHAARSPRILKVQHKLTRKLPKLSRALLRGCNHFSMRCKVSRVASALDVARVNSQKKRVGVPSARLNRALLIWKLKAETSCNLRLRHFSCSTVLPGLLHAFSGQGGHVYQLQPKAEAHGACCRTDPMNLSLEALIHPGASCHAQVFPTASAAKDADIAVGIGDCISMSHGDATLQGC